MEDEVDQRLVSLLSYELDEGLGSERLSELVRGESVLGEGEVEELDGWRIGQAEMEVRISSRGRSDSTKKVGWERGGREGGLSSSLVLLPSLPSSPSFLSLH